MEKKDWNETEFTEKIRITKEDLEYVRSTKGKKSLAGRLREIICRHKKHDKN